MINRDIKTTELVTEIINRMSDWFEDPEPQHDDYFAKCNQGSLELAYNTLRNCRRSQTAALLKRKE
jgi:hypothetical protein